MNNYFKYFLKNLYYKLFLKSSNYNYPNWKILLNNLNFNKIKNQKKVLIATSTGGHRLALSSEILFGLSLKARGASVDFLLCDQALSTCSQAVSGDFTNKEFEKEGVKKKCAFCWNVGYDSLNIAGFKCLKYSDYFSEDDEFKIQKIIKSVKIEKIRSFTLNGTKVGEHVYAGTLRFFAKGHINLNTEEINVLKKYFYSGLKTYFISRNIFKKKKYDVVLLNHGIYIPQGVIAEVAKQLKLRVVTWFTSYKNKTYLLSHNETFHKSLLNEKKDDWFNLKIDKNKNKVLRNYIESRKYGTNDWIFFHNKNPKFNFNLKKYLKVNSNEEFVSLFTNVVWDAQLLYDQNIFNNMIEWLIETIGFFIKIKKILVIRAHPAEVSGTLVSKQKIFDEIIKVYKKIPDNIVFIHPEDPISSYAIIKKSQFCIIYASTIGIEIAAMGKAVITGGEAWIKNKNISFDPKTKKEYFEIIRKLIKDPAVAKDKKSNALKYAYYFFFKRMIPVNMINDGFNSQNLNNFNIKTDNMKKIFRGPIADLGIAKICDGILENKEFIYDNQ
jgi:hypothetical protein